MPNPLTKILRDIWELPLLALQYFRSPRPHHAQWHEYDPLPFKKIGDANGKVMRAHETERRYRDGKWEYREIVETDEEAGQRWTDRWWARRPLDGPQRLRRQLKKRPFLERRQRASGLALGPVNRAIGEPSAPRSALLSHQCPIPPTDHEHRLLAAGSPKTSE